MATVAGNWPQFRGRVGQGIMTETYLSAEWSADKNVEFEVAIPGERLVVADRLG